MMIYRVGLERNRFTSQTTLVSPKKIPYNKRIPHGAAVPGENPLLREREDAWL